MQDAAYELIALGFRYVFLALLLLTLLRAALLMRSDHRAHQATLRSLPDAGLVGELVDLQSGKAYPLPREGMMGSGFSCDIRLPGLRRREIEFAFKPGFGLRLFPVGSGHGRLLDNLALHQKDDYALHGTVLSIRGKAFRFRFFAGLDLPLREATYTPAVDGQWQVQSQADASALSDWETGAVLQQANPFSDEGGDPGRKRDAQAVEMTWQYAPFPQDASGAAQQMPQEPAPQGQATGGQADNLDDAPQPVDLGGQDSDWWQHG